MELWQLPRLARGMPLERHIPRLPMSPNSELPMDLNLEVHSRVDHQESIVAGNMNRSDRCQITDQTRNLQRLISRPNPTLTTHLNHQTHPMATIPRTPIPHRHIPSSSQPRSLSSLQIPCTPHHSQLTATTGNCQCLHTRRLKLLTNSLRDTSLQAVADMSHQLPQVTCLMSHQA